MNKLILLLLLTPLVHADEYAVCYYCSSDVDDDLYDPECATNGYDGHNGELAFTYSCYTEVYGYNSINRGFDSSNHDDGECEYIHGKPDKMRCYCNADRCNNNNCQHCFTPTSTQDTTTEDVTTMSTHTPEYTTTTTAKPSQGLTCYSCLNCSTVDGNTITATDLNFQTCVTAILGNKLYA
ncbi:unnamed protein product [Meganyctiphanes norvegica]|uniref:Uncharacterized protein n=1 Tax=Meganyctiphanes norvegica TaxID=48144 RepID=A0AAV2PNK7_MEGNR